MFAMCFRVGGGVLTLGGVDKSLHRNGSVSVVGTVLVVLIFVFD